MSSSSTSTLDVGDYESIITVSSAETERFLAVSSTEDESSSDSGLVILSGAGKTEELPSEETYWFKMYYRCDPSDFRPTICVEFWPPFWADGNWLSPCSRPLPWDALEEALRGELEFEGVRNFRGSLSLLRGFGAIDFSKDTVWCAVEKSSRLSMKWLSSDTIKPWETPNSDDLTRTSWYIGILPPLRHWCNQIGRQFHTIPWPTSEMKASKQWLGRDVELPKLSVEGAIHLEHLTPITQELAQRLLMTQSDPI